MTSNSTFKNQTLTFYFDINGLSATSDRIAYKAAEKINSRAYSLLTLALPKQAFWTKQDDQDPEVKYSPYEWCVESQGDETFGETVAFSFAIFSYHTMDQNLIEKFRKCVAGSFEQAAVELHGTAKLIRTESTLTQEVVTTTVLNLADQTS